MNGKNMIIISSRKDFNDADNVSETGHIIKEINLEDDTSTKELLISDLLFEIQGKRLLLLVHGYNNEQFEVYDSHSIIADKVNNLIRDQYDLIIGYSWPGGDRATEWSQGKSRANAIARLFRNLLGEISREAAVLDIMSHSLGARVCLKALKDSPTQRLVRNYFCTAPAVDNEALEPNQEFYDALSSCGRLFVFHSARDGVLRVAYTTAELNRALGLHGPEDKDYISRRARIIYVANCKNIVDHHGGYKRSDKMYKYIGWAHSSNPPKFKTL